MRVFNTKSILQLATVILVSVTLTACASTGFEKKNSYSERDCKSMHARGLISLEQKNLCRKGQDFQTVAEQQNPSSSAISQSSMTDMTMEHQKDCPCCKSGQCPMMKKGSMDHSEHQMPKGENAYAAAMDKMHKSMMIKGTGDADVDFMRSMIPHHQGAIDMAKIALQKAKDPVVRKLAEDIIKAQEKEISLMQNWLTTRIEP